MTQKELVLDAKMAARYPHLARTDLDLFATVVEEERHRLQTLDLIAAQSIVSPAIQEILASPFVNRFAVEGTAGSRYHAGVAAADAAEKLAIDRACELYSAEYANVQPHAGVSANLAAFAALIKPGDRLLSMSLRAGGHVSHGTKVSLAGQIYQTAYYGVDPATGQIDYDEVARMAEEFKPQLLVAGASSYPRTLDFARFGEIARSVGALFLADIAHIAGLVAGGAHASPLPHADVVTASTYKTLRGPKGGFILAKEQYADAIERAVFPGTQGGVNASAIVAKAYAFGLAQTERFAQYAAQVVQNARAFADGLRHRGFALASGGTDTHMVVLDLRDSETTGKDAQERLEAIGIDTNRNVMPNDPRGIDVTSGVRMGTASATVRGLGTAEMTRVAEIVADALSDRLEMHDIADLTARVAELCDDFPMNAVDW